jgi:hypothetical protein
MCLESLFAVIGITTISRSPLLAFLAALIGAIAGGVFCSRFGMLPVNVHRDCVLDAKKLELVAFRAGCFPVYGESRAEVCSMAENPKRSFHTSAYRKRHPDTADILPNKETTLSPKSMSGLEIFQRLIGPGFILGGIALMEINFSLAIVVVLLGFVLLIWELLGPKPDPTEVVIKGHYKRTMAAIFG